MQARSGRNVKRLSGRYCQIAENGVGLVAGCNGMSFLRPDEIGNVLRIDAIRAFDVRIGTGVNPVGMPVVGVLAVSVKIDRLRGSAFGYVALKIGVHDEREVLPGKVDAAPDKDEQAVVSVEDQVAYNGRSIAVHGKAERFRAIAAFALPDVNPCDFDRLFARIMDGEPLDGYVEGGEYRVETDRID